MKYSIFPVLVAVLLVTVCASVPGCGSGPKPMSPEEQRQLDEEMKKAVEQNKNAK